MNSIIGIIMACTMHYSLEHNIDPAIVNAVIRIESNFNHRAIGQVGEVGLMQIRPKYSKYDEISLIHPCINIKEGIRMLLFAKKNCKHRKKHQYVICYNKGVTGGSRIKYPTKDTYYKKIMRVYNDKNKLRTTR